MAIDLYCLGIRISYYRRKAGYSQVELAEKVGLSEKQIYYVEKGIKGISLDKLIEISNAIGVTPDELLKDSVDILDKQNSTDILMSFMKCTKSEIMFLKRISRYLEEIIKNIDP